MKPGKKGLARWRDAFRYSFQGFRAAYRYEAAFREETWLLVASIPVAIWLGENLFEIAMLIGSVLLVMVIELLNSAIESLTDKVSHEPHPLAGRAKDMGSAAVLVGLVIMALVWIGILWPKLHL